jgi:hypothetical protein
LIAILAPLELHVRTNKVHGVSCCSIKLHG